MFYRVIMCALDLFMLWAYNGLKILLLMHLVLQFGLNCVYFFLFCLQCWDQCATAPSKINTSIQEAWPLRIITMIRQGSLVSADVAWPTMSSPSQCLVTWEVSGGGLMGNLLTDSSSVQLSLWPETKYRVQVTCKNKVNISLLNFFIISHL